MNLKLKPDLVGFPDFSAWDTVTRLILLALAAAFTDS
jgi:hypothetical protein